MPSKLLWPDDVELPSGRDGVLARMSTGELYFVSDTLMFERPSLLADHRAVITRHVRENAGEKPVELLTYNIDSIIARALPPVKEKLDRLLRALAAATDFQVEQIQIRDGRTSLPFALCREAGLSGLPEMLALLEFASSTGLCEMRRHSSGVDIKTTIRGIIHVEEADRSLADSRAAFVAMWFGAEVSDAYATGMVPAIEANGWEPVRIDNREYNNRIDDEIISEIRRARFVVADFSCGADGARGGVYFEAGFALALDKPVIFTVREADLPRVHFDTRQFNHIVWSDPADLAEKLKNRIGATIGHRTSV